MSTDLFLCLPFGLNWIERFRSRSYMRERVGVVVNIVFLATD